MKSVRFGNRGALKIEESSILSAIKDGIESQIGYSMSDKRHSLLNAKTLKRLEKTPYQVGVNTLGQRFLLLLTTVDVGGNSKRWTIFINRKSGMMIVVRFRFTADLFVGPDENAFQGSLFEGELIRCKKGNKTEWHYLISDILVDRGSSTKETPFEKRLARIGEIVGESHVPDNKQDPCKVHVKRYFGYDNIQSIVDDYIPTLPFQNAVTGLSFKSNTKNILYILPEFRASKKSVAEQPKKTTKITIPKGAIKKRRESSTPKVPAVSPEDHDGHFKVVETDMPDVYELFDRKGNRGGYAAIPDLDTSNLMNDLLEEVDETGETLYMKCEFSKKFSKWVPKERTSPF